MLYPLLHLFPNELQAVSPSMVWSMQPFPCTNASKGLSDWTVPSLLNNGRGANGLQAAADTAGLDTS